LNIAQPDFYGRFFCIGAACEDSCCSGMGVVIDKQTYDKYQQCQDDRIKPLLQLKVLPNPKATNPASFATVVLNGPSCPFLQTDDHCLIQETLGKDYLSRTCDTYPRAFSKVDDTLERSLYLSCPEAARIILLRSSQIRIDAPGASSDEKYSEFPSVDTNESLFAGKPYGSFGAIRNFVIRLIRNRDYLVWERMVILGMYCEQLSRIPVAELQNGAPRLTESFTQHIVEGGFRTTLDEVEPNYALLLNVVIGSIEDRLKSGYTSPRFIDCYRSFIEGIGYRDGIDTPTLAAQYSAGQNEYYQPFMASREYIWENYLIAKAYKDLFPFGPQQSLYGQTRTVYQEFVLLASQYFFVRTLLAGFAGFAREKLSQEDIVRIVQSFSRAVEHDLPYLTKLLTSLEHGKIAELPTLARLIKL
jgi:lysine-N-methylase